MPGPLFSIVIPTYNRCDLLQGTVRSVLAQSIADFEVVVSDNCSDDDTRHVAEGFVDSRVRYIRTPRHTSIADSWEFARSHARGTLVMMLSDDDALVRDALARFAEAHHERRADFLFCGVAEYRDQSFVGPLFAFRPKFDMHPSAFMFAASVADRVVQRSGRFFRSNGVEYFAWPLAAVFAKNIVYIDRPLVILGRTAKSWGSTIVLSNPGKEKIQKMIADVAHSRDWIPLTNFTLCNLMAEGMLLGLRMFPDELRPFPFDEQQYLRSTMAELRRREAMGVDVSKEMEELLTYAAKYPALKTELTVTAKNGLMHRDSTVRKVARALRLNVFYGRFLELREVRKINRGEVKPGFAASGRDFGFKDAEGCANFVARVTHQ